MLYYLFVFLAAFVVDLLPFAGPPAWTVMVFFQMKFGLNVWAVLVVGVLGSTLGRYILSLYIPVLSNKFIKPQKNEDIRFIGQKLADKGWKVPLFVIIYTLMPLPSTPLFTAAGMAKIKAIRILPAFIVGKFTSDMFMVLAGDYAVKNAEALAKGFWSWKTLSGSLIGIIIIAVFLFIDWHKLLQEKKFRLSIKIWK